MFWLFICRTRRVRYLRKTKRKDGYGKKTKTEEDYRIGSLASLLPAQIAETKRCLL